MVQRKVCQVIRSDNLQPETRFGQEHIKILGPEMMMMKRTKPRKKLKDSTLSPSGKLQTPPRKHDLVVKSPNYMKSTTSSEARKENKKRFNLSINQKNQTSSSKKRIVKGLTKTPSFKRCSQRATCSSTLKDSKFPNYLMLNHGETHDQVNGTSVLRVCPYTYCSLNGHLQYPPLKSFISSRRRSLKSQKNVKIEGSKEELMEMFVEEKKECEIEVEIDTQISETFSEGAPRFETDSDGYSDSSEMVKFPECDLEIELRESDLEETLVDESVKEIQESYKKTLVDEYVEEIQESYDVDDVEASSLKPLKKIKDALMPSEMVRFSEDDLAIEFKESDMEETLVAEIQETCEVDAIGEVPCSNLEETQVDDSVKDKIQEDEVMAKIPFNRTRKSCNQEDQDSSISWTINKRKKQLEETEDLKEFNPKEPNYLPVVVDEDKEKVDLKHQDMDDRRNSEDWMIDYALQRAVTKLSSERKRKVALLVEAFETVKPIIPHGRESTRHLQACN